MVFAASLFLPLTCAAVTHGGTTKAPVDPYDQWIATAATTLDRLPDPDGLVTAALLQPLIGTSGRQSLQRLDQAAKQEPAAADIAALAMLKCEEISGCDTRTRARHLQTLAPANALGWLLDLHAASQQNDAPQVTRILQRMAQAGHFRTYQTSLTKRIHDGLEDLSPPPFENGPRPYHLSGDNARILQTRILVNLLPVPAYQDLVFACQPNEAEFALRTPACRRIATELTQSWSLLAHLIGVNLQRWTARDAQDYRQALVLGREADWLMPMRGTYCDNQAHIVSCLGVDMKAASELDACRAIARQQGKPVTPPDTWVDRNQQRRIHRDQEKFHHSPGFASANGKPSFGTDPAPGGTKHSP